MKSIEKAAAARKTLKLLGDPARPLAPEGLSRSDVEELVTAAGWAPFHRPAYRAREQGERTVEPWRFTMLDAPACRALLPRLSEIPKPPGKISNMLAVADALLLVTWLPEPSADGGWEANAFNMEHIAAGSAAIQTLLLAATARGIGNYWSSGGALGTAEAFEMLGIDKSDVLLGAIFLFPDPPDSAEAVPGKMREKRSAPAAWSRWAELG